MSLCQPIIWIDRHVAWLRRHQVYAPTSNTATHDNHEEVNSWSPFLSYMSMGLRLVDLCYCIDLKVQRTFFGGGEWNLCPKDVFGSEMYAVYTNISCLSFDLIDTMRGYLTQLRQELGQRIIEAVFDPQTDKPSKVHVLSSTCNIWFSSQYLIIQWHVLEIRHTDVVWIKRPGFKPWLGLGGGALLLLVTSSSNSGLVKDDRTALFSSPAILSILK